MQANNNNEYLREDSSVNDALATQQAKELVNEIMVSVQNAEKVLGAQTTGQAQMYKKPVDLTPYKELEGLLKNADNELTLLANEIHGLRHGAKVASVSGSDLNTEVSSKTSQQPGMGGLSFAF